MVTGWLKAGEKRQASTPSKAGPSQVLNAIFHEVFIRPLVDPQPKDGPGVYIQLGTRGTRVGKSSCLKRRVPRSNREHRSCLGNDITVGKIPMPGSTVQQRRQLEQRLIDTFQTTRSCNLRRS